MTADIQQMESQRDALVNELTGLAQRAGVLQSSIAELNAQIHASKHGDLYEGYLQRRQQADIADQQSQQEKAARQAEREAEHRARLNANVDVGKQIREEMASMFNWRP